MFKNIVGMDSAYKHAKSLNPYSNMGISVRLVVDMHNEILALRQRVRELESQVPKWISVEDRLPDDPKEVLGLLSSGMLRICKHYQNDNIWREAMSYERLYNVTCWMPLPQKPKGEKR